MPDANDEMAALWDGALGEKWAADSDRYQRMSAGFRQLLVDAVEPRTGEIFLDVGCGHGALTRELARLTTPGGRATGIDISTPMLGVARQLAAQAELDNIDFVRVDAQTADLGEPVDAIVSQFGVMFFADHAAAFANLRRALRAGGRLAYVCWQELGRQDWVMIPTLAALRHLPIPTVVPGGVGTAAFSLADPDHNRQLLETAGFTSITVDNVEAPEYQGADIEDTIAYLQRSEIATTLFAGAQPDVAAEAWHAIVDALAPYVTKDGVYLTGAAWLVQARSS